MDGDEGGGEGASEVGHDQDAAVEKDRTMDEDAGRTTRPIRARAETPDEINESFDQIAYGKAGAVIGMVENYVGEEVFRRGVHEYLTEHSYANATAEDFWNAQARVSGLPVDKVMRSFVEQPGVPLVTLWKRRRGRPVAQRRFFLSGAAPNTKEAWTIPVCFKGASCRLLTPGATTWMCRPGAVGNGVAGIAIYVCGRGRQGVLPDRLFGGTA